MVRILSESQTAEKTSAVELRFAAGCTLLDNHTIVNLGQFDMADDEWKSVNEKMLSEAVECARWADKVVLALGEHRFQSEATSKTDITLPKIQMELLRRVAAVNKNVITVLFNGRPLDLREGLRVFQGYCRGMDARELRADTVSWMCSQGRTILQESCR